MHDFHCKKADDMKNKLLAERTRYLKETDKGDRHMCRIIEEMLKEERAERDIEIATKILEKGKMSEESVKELFNFSETQMNTIKEIVKETVSVTAK